MSKKRKSNKLMIAVALVAVAMIILLIKINDKKDDSNLNDDTPQTESFDVPFKKHGELYFLSDKKNIGDTIAKIDIEIADTDYLCARGLMYRKSIPANGGMLFLFEDEEIKSFWMKNTYISLDMIFVNSDNEIVTIHPNTAKLKEWNYASTKPAKNVIEVNAGFCAKNGIVVGYKVSYNRD